MPEINNGYMSQRVFDSLNEMVIKLNSVIKEQVMTINNYNDLIIKYAKTPLTKLYEPTKNDVDIDLDGKTFDQIVSIVKELQEIVKSQKLTISTQENEIRQLQSMSEDTIKKETKVDNPTGALSTKGIFDESDDTPFSPPQDLNKDINKIF